MKVWQKNFLYTFTLFTVLFFVCIYIVNTLSFSNALQSERETAMREESLLSSTLQKDIYSIETRDNFLQGIASRVASYAPTYQKKDIYIILKNGDKSIYSSYPDDIETKDARKGSRICKIIEAEGNRAVCVYDILTSSHAEDYTFVFIKNITPVYSSLSNQSRILNMLGVAVSFVFAVLLYLALRSIYKPVNNLAHELRTPLTAIRGYAEYLQNAASTEEERYSATKFIIDESKRLSDICDRLLIMANLREGDICFEELNIERIFENTKMIFKNVEYEVSENSIKGEKTLVQSMINNLVSNAVKASPPDATVRLKCYNNVIEVEDKGKGMSDEMLWRISKSNYHPDITGRHPDGNGLGLPLCRQIAKLHNANFEIVSEVGKGTTVYIVFTDS